MANIMNVSRVKDEYSNIWELVTYSDKLDSISFEIYTRRTRIKSIEKMDRYNCVTLDVMTFNDIDYSVIDAKRMCDKIRIKADKQHKDAIKNGNYSIIEC